MQPEYLNIAERNDSPPPHPWSSSSGAARNTVDVLAWACFACRAFRLQLISPYT
jgi:hypothetical protein